MKANPDSVLHRFFCGVTEFVFHSQLGVVDPPLVDYVGELLSRFVHVDAVHRVRNLRGKPMTRVAEMLFEAHERVGTAKREVHQHIGDFTLFWSGVYPEALRALQDESKKDHFLDYCVQGKRAYHIASMIDTDLEGEAPNDVLARLSDEFELCAYGLREVRREWERRDEDGELPQSLLLE